MANKEVIIEATPEGKVTVTASGYKGKSCKEATKSFEEALGTVNSDTPTKEMTEKPLNQKVKVAQ